MTTHHHPQQHKVIIRHRDSDGLRKLGEFLVGRWPDVIGSTVNFDPGNLGEGGEKLRLPGLEFTCPNELSGEILMVCIRLPGAYLDLQNLDE